MKKNMGTADKTIRILIAVAVVILYFTNTISGALGIILMIFAFIFVLTSLVSICPLYSILGISTDKIKSKNK